MTASAISNGHGTRRSFVPVEFEWFISESASLGDGDGETAHDALVCEEEVET